MYKLVHISDPHLPPPGEAGANWRDIASKRTLSRIAWRKKHKQHDKRILDALVADLRAWEPDHIALTGDLTNFSTEAEYMAAQAWLRSLGDPADITVSPGNHDALVDQGLERRIAGFSSWFGDGDQTGFPYVRRRGPVAIVNLRSAVPTAWHLATGRLGDHQLDRLEAALAQLRRAGAYRVVLLHHPPAAGVVSKRKALDDAAGFREVIRREGAELILHGHAHEAVFNAIGAVPVIGVPSASATPGHHHPAARWHGFEIAADGSTLVTVRGLDGHSPQVTELGRYVLPSLSARSAA